jgi:hypothetical protein
MAVAGSYRAGKFISRTRVIYNTENGLTNESVLCLLIDGQGRLLAGTKQGLYMLKSGHFAPVFANRISGAVNALALLDDGTVAVGEGPALYYLKNGALKEKRAFDSDIVSMECARGSVWILTKTRLVCSDYALENDSIDRELEGGEGRDLAVHDRNMFVATDGFLSLIHGKRNEWKNIMPRFSAMPEGEVYSLNFDENGCLWLGTQNGALIYDTQSRWIDSRTVNTLPQNPVYKTAFDKKGGIYFATDTGIAYLGAGRIKYFTADRWVPCNIINDIAVTDDGNVIYAATDNGVSEIRTRYITLSEKADIYEDILEKYHIRRGFTANRHINGYDPENGFVTISDNDGLWTGCYVAAESFRYAATGSKEALEKARRGMKAMLLLTKITGIPGFTARAVRYPGEAGYGNGNREWHKAKNGKCEWKGETSSDEMTGHFFGFSIYYDLCADEKEKKAISKALCGIADHIIENNYRLVDADGLPTTWACWDPHALNYDERWFAERGINSLEFLGFLKVCAHVSGKEKYKKLYDEFTTRHFYQLNLMSHKVKDAHMCHIDDNLAFLASLTLLRLENNEAVRAAVLCAMEDHWQYERPERQPLFSVIHAAMTGRDDDLCEGIQSLREIPLDLIHYRMENSRRRDLVWDTEQEQWHGEKQLKYALPYDERNVGRPDGSCLYADSRGGGMQEPTVYLLPYWAGRYYGIIAED